MARYIVLKNDLETKREKLLVLRDDFAVLALAFPLPWLLFKRLWLHAFVVLLILAFISYLSEETVTFGIALVSNIALGLIVALEGQSWVINKAKRRGYREIGSVNDAYNLQEAELLVLDKYAIDEDAETRPAMRPVHQAPAPGDTNILLGRP
ncbi:MAG: DUF2628 domain-containing protein [Pseudomonadota bacterium]